MGVVVAGCAHSGSTPATTSARPAPQLHYVALPAEHARAIHYRPDALTLYSPRPGYRPAVSPRQVLRLYYSWPAGPKLKGVPTIQLKTVNDGNPNPSAHDYPGWVVTAFDAWYGTGIIRVVKAKPAIAATLTG